MRRRPQRSTLFPYTTLFRSKRLRAGHAAPLPRPAVPLVRVVGIHRDDGPREIVLHLAERAAGSLVDDLPLGRHGDVGGKDRKSTRRTPVTSASRMPSSA